MRAHSSRNWGDYATGAVPHQRDPRDYRMEHIPGVAAQAEIGVPESYTLAPLVKSIYTQGTIPCCVMASIALMESIQDQIDRGAWRVYDFLEAYHSVGGNGRGGVPSRAALARVVRLDAEGVAGREPSLRSRLPAAVEVRLG